MILAPVVAWVALLAVLWTLFRALMKREAKRVVEEFVRIFPG